MSLVIVDVLNRKLGIQRQFLKVTAINRVIRIVCSNDFQSREQVTNFKKLIFRQLSNFQGAQIRAKFADSDLTAVCAIFVEIL